MQRKKALIVCLECSHEWAPIQVSETPPEDAPRFRDTNGTPSQDGDSVTIIKALKAGKNTIKVGTKVKNIKPLDSHVNGIDISYMIAGFGAMQLKCSVVKKA